MQGKTYVDSCPPGGMELTTWMRRALIAIKQKGLQPPVHQRDGMEMLNIGELGNFLKAHEIHIDRSGYLNQYGLVSDFEEGAT